MARFQFGQCAWMMSHKTQLPFQRWLCAANALMGVPPGGACLSRARSAAPRPIREFVRYAIRHHEVDCPETVSSSEGPGVLFAIDLAAQMAPFKRRIGPKPDPYEGIMRQRKGILYQQPEAATLFVMARLPGSSHGPQDRSSHRAGGIIRTCRAVRAARRHRSLATPSPLDRTPRLQTAGRVLR